ncbi:MAG: HD domain-containing protein [Prevotella sp.]|nr:HD domain-containing protein [Paraprevotella sp.]MCI6201659.1 HD domain-containing protein [Paraprevotella sp.]MDD5855708.1 HD domain-containing protein [Prevotella sp.]MDD7692700.1 HD domain-containing protein [Prevotella sp.]MDY4408918.1 HD domain-containing protein [Prevotella sp.]
MLERNVNLELMAFIETNILPRYTQFDKAHNLTHVTRVINRSIRLAQNIGTDVNMAYAIAAYHDLGLEGPRAIHHITGGKILKADVRLKKWFNNDQIKIMKEAIEDHRASASHAPRSIFGKIIAEADRDIEPEIVFRRTIQFGLSHYPELDKEKQWKRFLEHMDNKYSSHGYIRLWIPTSDNAKKLQEIRALIAQPIKLKQIFDNLYNEELSL